MLPIAWADVTDEDDDDDDERTPFGAWQRPIRLSQVGQARRHRFYLIEDFATPLQSG